MTRGLFEVQVPFFRPVWRRVVVTALCLGWAVFELSSGAAVWAALFGAAGVYLLWQFFIARWPQDGGGEE